MRPEQRPEQRIEQRPLGIREGTNFFQESFRLSQGNLGLQVMLFEMLHRLHPELTLPESDYKPMLTQSEERFKAYLPPSNAERTIKGIAHKGAQLHGSVRRPKIHADASQNLIIMQAILNGQDLPESFPSVVISGEDLKEIIMNHITKTRQLPTWKLTWKIIQSMVKHDEKFITSPDGRPRAPRPTTPTEGEDSQKQITDTSKKQYVPALDRRLSFVKYYLMKKQNTSSELMNEVLQECRKQYPFHLTDMVKLIRAILKGKKVERQRLQKLKESEIPQAEQSISTKPNIT